MAQYRVTEAQSNIQGSQSGNQRSNNVIRSNLNTYVLQNVTNFSVGSESGRPVWGVGDNGSRPYRLIPYGRNKTFTGRENLIASVKSYCTGPGHNRVALQGLGGSGKTQIALEYLYQCIDERDCDAFWVQGSGLLKFTEGFRAVAQLVQVPLPSATHEEEDFLISLRRWFEGPVSGDWILVIDNADDEADFVSNSGPVAKFIPQGTKGTIIFTTRSRQVASRQGCKAIGVGKMGGEEALELFSKRFDSWDILEGEEKKVVSMILGSVDHLPLAIIGSVAFMVETATPPSDYWNIFQENEEQMKELLSMEFCDIQRESGVTESTLGTFFVTFDRIRQQMPAAADLLRLMAFLDRQNIPEELLSQCGLERIRGSISFRLAIGKLTGFSLVAIVKHGNRTFYELHRLVQLSLQVYLGREDLNEAKSAALNVVSRLFPRDENQRRCIRPAYIPHAIAVTKDATDPTAEELCFRMGQYFLDMGFYNNAENRFRQCIALREEGKEYEWDDQGHWRLMQLGVVSTFQGKFEEAEAITSQVLEWCETILGPDHPDTLTSIEALGTVLREQEKYYASEALSQRSLKGREKLLGPHHPDTLKSVHNLAATLWGLGKDDESEGMTRRALEGREKFLGPDHPHTLTSVCNLAITLSDQEKHSESEAMERRALEGREKVLGPYHPDTLTTISNLAITLQSQGNYSESEVMNRRALEGREKFLGPHHPHTLASISNLAILLRSQGNYSESEAMHRRALEGRENVLGQYHLDTLKSISSLAITLRSQGKYSESEEMHRRALQRQEQVLGPHHPDALTSVSNIAITLWSQGKYSESEAIYRRALEGQETVLGPHHPDTLGSIGNLAIALQDQEKYRESEEMHRRVFEGRKKVLGSDHPDTLQSARRLAVVLCDQR